MMGHTPYGYRIENGSAVINESEAECIRRIYDNYISGMGLREAAKAVGYPVVHSTVKRILTRKCYCGDDFYPPIIDAEQFQKANQELKTRSASLRMMGRKRRTAAKPLTEFEMSVPEVHYDDPYQQAEYLYSLIESTAGKLLESKVVKWQK